MPHHNHKKASCPSKKCRHNKLATQDTTPELISVMSS